VNLVLALALFTTLFIVGSGGYRLGFVLQAKGEKVLRTVDTVSLGYPASRIGLRPGDAIVAIDRKPVSAGGIHDAIASSNGRPLTLTVQRGAKRVTLGPARPRKDPQVSFATAVGRSLRLSGQMVRGTGVGLAHLVTGKNRHELAGPVGIVHISSEAASEGVRPYLFILGLVSLSLGVFNLLPFLPLDGGHILLSTIEGVRRRALGRAVYERFAAIGIALVLILAFIVLSNDIGGLGGG
jgi:regulator of sigma E protease